MPQIFTPQPPFAQISFQVEDRTIMNDHMFDGPVRRTSVADAPFLSSAATSTMPRPNPLDPDVAMANKRRVNLVERGKSVPLFLGVLFPCVVPRVDYS
jgi:hypothetical protein